MTPNNLEEVLKQVQSGSLSVDEAKGQLRTYHDLGFAKVDVHREQRQGFPEVIYGEGKTVDQIVIIARTLLEKTNSLLITRVEETKAGKIREQIPQLTYNPMARVLYGDGGKRDGATPETSHKTNHRQRNQNPIVNVICAGTSDLPVAEEAAITAEQFGCTVERIHDVGVAGIHRLLDKAEQIRNGTVSIVVAGMEGALPSVVGGLVNHPVIAVPTSIGYGANFQGLSALLSMLNSCSSGISVVNIDNGFGAGYNAALIIQQIEGKHR